MKPQTLLEKARMVEMQKRSGVSGEEEMELMIALANGEVRMTQAAKAAGTSQTGIAQRCFVILRHGIVQGKLARLKRISKNGE